MKPEIEEFRRVSDALIGNITKIALYFGVDRRSAYRWMRNKPFMDAIEDSRGAFLDECIQMARLVALGVPEVDENGKFKGWKVHPDTRMLKYFISKLGREDGFFDSPEEKKEVVARVISKVEFFEIFGKDAP